MLSPSFVLFGLTVALAGTRPVWKPEAADLLFTSGRSGNSEIFLLSAGKPEWVNLTNHDSGDNWPSWSPDGTRIAYQNNRSGKLDVWTMAANGGNAVQLTTDPEPDYLPAWSPDGKSIVFTSWRVEKGDATRAPHVYIMNADGSGQRRLVAESLHSSEGATFAPDGRRIVYARKVGESGADIFIADHDGKNERRLTNDAGNGIYNGSPTVSPDGKSIAFYSDDKTGAALAVMKVDGSRRRTVLTGGHNWYPRWSPDGRWLVYTASVSGGDEGNVDVFAVRVAGDRKPVLLVGGAKRELEGSWRP